MAKFLRNIMSTIITTKIRHSDGKIVTKQKLENGTFYSEKTDEGEWIQIYDTRGNIIYVKHLDGMEVWNDYDDNGTLIKHRNSEGRIIERIEKRDSKGNVVYFEDCYGHVYEKKFDINGFLIYEKANGIEYWFGYDEWGNMSYYKDSLGKEERRYFNDCGKLIKITVKVLSEAADNISYATELWEYNDNGDISYHKDLNGNEEWYEYTYGE